MHYARWKKTGDPGPADKHKLRGRYAEKICQVPGCSEPVKARNWCGAHYARVLRTGNAGSAEIFRPVADEDLPPCKREGCDKQSYRGGKGWCATHYGRYRATGDPGPAEIGSYRPRSGGCEAGRCGKPIQSDRLCQMHYVRKLQGRDIAAPVRRARGDGSVTRDGYRVITVGGKQVLEHRFVMEEFLGRPLAPGENVHHINGNRLENSPKNLQLWFKGQPAGQRVSDLIAYIATYHAHEMRAELRRAGREKKTGQLRLAGMPAAHITEAP